MTTKHRLGLSSYSSAWAWLQNCRSSSPTCQSPHPDCRGLIQRSVRAHSRLRHSESYPSRVDSRPPSSVLRPSRYQIVFGMCFVLFAKRRRPAAVGLYNKIPNLEAEICRLKFSIVKCTSRRTGVTPVSPPQPRRAIQTLATVTRPPAWTPLRRLLLRCSSASSCAFSCVSTASSALV